MECSRAIENTTGDNSNALENNVKDMKFLHASITVYNYSGVFAMGRQTKANLVI